MSCVAKVRATLTSLENVDNVAVDFKKKNATVRMKSGTLKKDTVSKALGKAGYEVTTFAQVKPEKYVLAVTGMS